ncbi:MAG: hypothetical protein ACHP78_20120, partial [Terriglobales bacterium]
MLRISVSIKPGQAQSPQDGEFVSFGHNSENQPNSVVPIGRRQFLQKLLEHIEHLDRLVMLLVGLTAVPDGAEISSEPCFLTVKL